MDSTLKRHRFYILLAEADESILATARDAFRLVEPGIQTRYTRDIDALLSVLRKQPPYEAEVTPDLILISAKDDVGNLARGLREIKSDDSLCKTPIVVLTRDLSPGDILLMYREGASSCIPIPRTAEHFAQLAGILVEYWFHIAIIPGRP